MRFQYGKISDRCEVVLLQWLLVLRGRPGVQISSAHTAGLQRDDARDRSNVLRRDASRNEPVVGEESLGLHCMLESERPLAVKDLGQAGDALVSRVRDLKWLRVVPGTDEIVVATVFLITSVTILSPAFTILHNISLGGFPSNDLPVDHVTNILGQVAEDVGREA